MPPSSNWPVAEKQLSLIMRYSRRITWKVSGGIDCLLLRFQVTSIERIPNWLTAQRIIETLRKMCMKEHGCDNCKAPCARDRHA